MNILITGSSGYIGTELCRRFDREPGIDEVVGLDLIYPKESFTKLKFYKQGCNGDLHNIFTNHKIDTLIHLVYNLNMTHDSEAMYRINVGSVENILNNAEEYGIQRILVTSSATAYGAHPDNPDILTEAHPLRGNEDYQYALDKTIVEMRLHEFGEKHPEVDIIIARPAIVCGAHIGNFISRYINKVLVPLVKDCDTEMQFLHEEDAAEALYQLATKAPDGVYNLGPPNTIHAIKIEQILGGKPIFFGSRLLKTMTGLAWNFHITSLTEAPAAMIDFLQYPWVVDGSKVEQKTDFRYQYSSEDAIRAFAEAQPKKD